VYDKTNKQIKWIIANLAEGESRKIAFTVFITPTKDQLNKLLVLTKETVVNAIDNNTNENISLNIERLTSDLPNDPAAAGKGVVEQKP
jgi:enoyl-[acyl-carrier-protein] reductase (NADH)